MRRSVLTCACIAAGTVAAVGFSLYRYFSSGPASPEIEEYIHQLKLDTCSELDLSQVKQIEEQSETSIEILANSPPSTKYSINIKGTHKGILSAHVLLTNCFNGKLYVSECIQFKSYSDSALRLKEDGCCFIEALRNCFDVNVSMFDEKGHDSGIIVLNGKRNNVIEALKSFDDHINHFHSTLRGGAFSYRTLEIGKKWFLAELTLINDIFEFYIRLVDQYENDYFHLFHALDECCRNRQVWPEDVNVKSFVAAKDASGHWFRGQVLSAAEQKDYFNIKNVDTGIAETVAKENIRIVGNSFFSIPFECIDCMLGKVSSKHESECFEVEEIRQFASLVGYKHASSRPLVYVRCDFTLDDEGSLIHAVDLKTQYGLCVSDELIKSGAVLPYK